MRTVACSEVSIVVVHPCGYNHILRQPCILISEPDDTATYLCIPGYYILWGKIWEINLGLA